MERHETIGFRVRTLSVAIRRAIDAGRQQQESRKCTGIHGWVIGYLYDNRHKDIYQKDIEKQFSVRRPTMTEILKLMEKNGLVERVKDDRDGRLKKIKLTPLALDIHRRRQQEIEIFEEYIRQGISDEELKGFFSTIEKICANVEQAEKEGISGKVCKEENE